MEDSEENLKKNKELYESGAISTTDYNKVKSQYEQDKLSYEKAVEDYNIKISNLNISLSDTYVRSPVNGIVGSRNIEQGEIIRTTVAAYVIIDPDPVIVEAQIPENIIGKVSIGQEAKIIIGSLNNKVYNSKVSSVGLLKSTSANTYPVEIKLDNKALELKPGMYSEVYIVLQKHSSIVVPKKVIMPEGDKKYVYVVNGTIAKRVEVTTGIVDGSIVEITNGLKQGDVVIIEGQSFVKDGIEVTIVTPEETGKADSAKK